MPAKYIRCQHRFIVFSDSIQHKYLADNALAGKLIHGAGFMTVLLSDGVLSPNCFGESESLRKKPRRDCERDIVESIGMKEGVPAKYLIFRGKVVVFLDELDHLTVAKAAFYGSIDCESAGYFTLSVVDGKYEIKCFGEVDGIAKSSADDSEKIASLFALNLI